MKKTAPCLLIALLTLLAVPAFASPADVGKAHVGIVAQVGDEAVSSVDVENRIKFIIATAHISNTPDMLAHVRPQVIRSLVDEKLEIQEATKNDITITQKDIDQAIEAIEQERGMPKGAIDKMLQENNVPKETFTQQIRAQLSWNELLKKKVRPFVHVSDAEIALASKQVIPAATEPEHNELPQEYQIGVLLLPVDKPSRENEIKHLAEKLVSDVRRGASFEELSRQFSSSLPGASGKVEPFWVSLAQVDPHIAQLLQFAKAGMISDPVRNSEGFTVIKVYKTRDLPGAKPPKPKEVAAPAPAPAAPVDEKAAKHEQLYGMLLQQKMQLEAQKYLRNLRRETYVEIRG